MRGFACVEATPAGCSLVNGTWIHTITGSKYNDEMMVTLNMHCHAPTCLEMSVYTCSMGMSLDECTKPITTAEALAKGYKLLCREAPVYGGSGNPHVALARALTRPATSRFLTASGEARSMGWCRP